MLGATVTVIISLDIPDVPPIEDSQYVDNLDEIDDEQTVNLGPGWEDEGEAVFAVIEVEIQENASSTDIGSMIQMEKIVQIMLMFLKT